MDGFQVMTMKKAAKIGDIFITATGDVDIIRGEHVELMKDGAVLANSGHFNVEINIPEIEKLAKEKKEIRENVVKYTLADGRAIYLLADGRLVNLAAAEGHPSEVMDMSFANQALAAKYVWENDLEPGVHNIPKEIDERVAKLKLETLGIKIDELTSRQKEYLASWEEGT
jgi:adenosylhomocysteinase